MPKAEEKKGGEVKNILFIRGNAISGAPIINGTNQFPKPPIIIGITIKKIITKACPQAKLLVDLIRHELVGLVQCLPYQL
ncbi:hypothetical protein AB720_19370, partial [Acinetobacter baumannii]